MVDTWTGSSTRLLEAMEREPSGVEMARYAVATFDPTFARFYGPPELVTALLRRGWTWADVLRVNR